MDTIKTDWSKNELLTYLLIYCMEADFEEDDEEIDFIRAKTDDDTFKKLYLELNEDNDFTRAQKIQSTIQRLNLEKQEINELLREMEDLFKTDGNYDMTEHASFIGLKKLLLG